MLRKASLAGVLATVALGLAGCGASRERGPAWPKPHASELDGGESLSPRQASAVAAIEEAEDATPSASSSAAPAGAAPALAPGKPDKPASETPAAREPKDPDVLTTEEIIIEIDD